MKLDVKLDVKLAACQRDLAWCIVMKLDEESEKRQTSLSFFLFDTIFLKGCRQVCVEIRGAVKHESFGGKMSQSD